MTLSITVEQNPTTSIGKRKRAVSDLADYVPGQLNVDGKQMVARTVSTPSSNFPQFPVNFLFVYNSY